MEGVSEGGCDVREEKRGRETRGSEVMRVGKE